MKKLRLLSLLITVVFGAILFSCNSGGGQKRSDNQTSIAARYDSIRKAEELEIEQARQDSIEQTQIKRYSVKKLLGKHKYGGTTKIEYKSLSQLLSETEEQAKKEMWTEEEKQSRLDTYRRAAKGGRIRLDIERSTIDAANTEYFSIIIKDLDEKEIYRANLDSDIPERPISNDYWWNIGYQWLDKRIKTPFYVYVVERGEDAPFKFEVTAIRK